MAPQSLCSQLWETEKGKDINSNQKKCGCIVRSTYSCTTLTLTLTLNRTVNLTFDFLRYKMAGTPVTPATENGYTNFSFSMPSSFSS